MGKGMIEEIALCCFFDFIIAISIVDVFRIDKNRIILSAVDNNTALELRDAAVNLNMDVLCEIHDAEELNRAIDLKMDMIGINNRNLRSFETSLQTSFDLIPHIPDGTCIISESGIFTHEDAQSLAQHGAHALLVGESLMRQPDVTAATKLLLNGK